MFSLSANYLTRGFWGDEAWTSLISQLPYLQMLKTTAADFHPPGYYTVVDLVYKFLPPTEVVTRSISIIFYFLTLFLVYKLASEIKGKSFGWISTLVVAVNPIFFTYAFEARNYTMFAFAATGSIYFLVKLSALRQAQDKNNFWPSVLFVAFSTLGIYTHYYMFFTLFAQALYLVVFDLKIFWRTFVLWIITAVSYLPWLPFLYGQVTSVGQSYWIGGIDKRTHFEALLRILGGEHQNAARVWLFGLSIILLTIGILQHLLRHHFEKPYLLIWLWAIVPFIVATLPGLKIDGVKLPFRPIFFWRYLIGASVPLAMVMVHTAGKFPKYMFGLGLGMLVGLSLVIDFLAFRRAPYTFREVYQQQVLNQIQSDDKLVTVLPSFAEALYYRGRFGLDNELIVLPEGLVQFSGKSLLDAYAENGVVKIGEVPTDGRYFELRPGPSVEFTGKR
ncbi:glycosyltransferase family 39 protein [Candidatus Curtissbacteria bacterium]|nr:glycosyltransferase family 39 protein [Candidatus Curtissbacteria bacterium]